MSSRASGQILELHRNIYSSARCERVYMTGETGVVCGLVVLRIPARLTLGTFLFFSSSPSATPRLAPRSRWHFTKERRERTRRGCGRRQRGEIYYGARGRAVADLILRSAARTSRPWCSAHACARVLMATIRWTDGVMVDRCTTSA